MIMNSRVIQESLPDHADLFSAKTFVPLYDKFD